MNTKKMITSALAVMLVLSMTACSGKDMPQNVITKKTVTADAPSEVETSSVNFDDHFTSDTENELTITWSPVSNASSYRITSKITGTTGRYSVIKKVNDSRSSDVYEGKDASAKITIRRNTLYDFSIYSVASDGKTMSKPATVRYFPSTYDNSGFDNDKNIIKGTVNNLCGSDESGKDAWKAHGNVLTLQKDYTYRYPDGLDRTYIGSDTARYANRMIIDLNGHTLNYKTKNFWIRIVTDKGLTITDSSNNGKITGHGYINMDQYYDNDDFVINNGIFTPQIMLGVSKAVINGGTFHIKPSKAEYAFANDGQPISSEGKPEITEAFINGTDKLTINNAKFIIDKGSRIKNSKSLISAITTDKFYPLNYKIEGTLKLSDDGKTITVEK